MNFPFSIGPDVKIIDLTHTLSENIPVHPLKTPFTRKVRAHYEHKACYEDIFLSSGIGTHMDAPRHFYADGKSIAEIPLEKCCGFACVLHLSEFVKDNADYEIGAKDILHFEKAHGTIPAHAIVLAHTGWDRYWMQEKYINVDAKGIAHFPGFSQSAAKLLLERNVNGVGIDTTGIDVGCAKDPLAHSLLLQKNLFLVEGLANLSKLPATGCFVYILPVKIKDAPESPVRAMGIFPKKH